MKVGIYFDMRNSPQWRQDWSRLYGFTLEMCQEAERLGLDSVWTSEHHMFEDGYLTQPLTMLAGVAGATKTIGLGTAVLLAPLRPAIQIAEENGLVSDEAQHRGPDIRLTRIGLDDEHLSLH